MFSELADSQKYSLTLCASGVGGGVSSHPLLHTECVNVSKSLMRAHKITRGTVYLCIYSEFYLITESYTFILSIERHLSTHLETT